MKLEDIIENFNPSLVLERGMKLIVMRKLKRFVRLLFFCKIKLFGAILGFFFTLEAIGFFWSGNYVLMLTHKVTLDHIGKHPWQN